MAQFGQNLSLDNYKKAIFNLIKTQRRRPRHAESHAETSSASNIRSANFGIPTQPLRTATCVIQYRWQQLSEPENIKNRLLCNN